RLRICIDRYAADADASRETVAESVPTQLTLFDPGEPVAAAPDVPELPPLPPIEVPAKRVGRLSYSALALYERCPYRFYAERIAGLRPVDGSVRENGAADRIDPVPNAVSTGLAATEVGDAVHRLLELVDLSAPAPPSLDQVLAWYPAATADELARIAGLVDGYCGSSLAARVAALPGAGSERPFAFEHDGVLFHGVLDVLQLEEGRALVADFKSNLLGELAPADIVEAEYQLQRLVYAIA